MGVAGVHYVTQGQSEVPTTKFLKKPFLTPLRNVSWLWPALVTNKGRVSAFPLGKEAS